MVSEVQGLLLSQFNGWGSGGPLTTVAQTRLGIKNKNKSRSSFSIFIAKKEFSKRKGYNNIRHPNHIDPCLKCDQCRKPYAES